jgi:mRNA-degrading endonuclease HigB of HigAB toxin-antitoxin module
VRILRERFLKDASVRHPRAAEALYHWARSIRAAKWKNFGHARKLGKRFGLPAGFFIE